MPRRVASLAASAVPTITPSMIATLYQRSATGPSWTITGSISISIAKLEGMAGARHSIASRGRRVSHLAGGAGQPPRVRSGPPFAAGAAGQQVVERKRIEHVGRLEPRPPRQL